MPCVTELDSIRIIACRVQIREENLYLLFTLLFLFSHYLYADQTRHHVSMVVCNAMANVTLSLSLISSNHLHCLMLRSDYVKMYFKLL
jgi:hypothetical protein